MELFQLNIVVLVIAVLAEFLLSFLISKIVLSKIPQKHWNSTLSKFLAIFPSLGEALILISFVLTLTMGFPISPEVKNEVSKSFLGSNIVKETVGLEAKIND